MLVNVGVTETVVTIIFDAEIIIRFFVSFPDWRTFFYKKSNCVDLFLAVATSVIQIPPIHNSGVYRWLTIFQILRVYRVIIAIPVTRNLLVRMIVGQWINYIEQSSEQCLRSLELADILVHDHFFLRYFGMPANTR